MGKWWIMDKVHAALCKFNEMFRELNEYLYELTSKAIKWMKTVLAATMAQIAHIVLLYIHTDGEIGRHRASRGNREKRKGRHTMEKRKGRHTEHEVYVPIHYLLES